MQDPRQLDRALARIAAARNAPAPRKVARGKITVDALLHFARKYGDDAVLYTGWEAGFDNATLLSLAESLDDIRVRAEGKRAKPLKGVQLAALVRRTPNYLGLEHA